MPLKIAIIAVYMMFTYCYRFNCCIENRKTCQSSTRMDKYGRLSYVSSLVANLDSTAFSRAT